jgi:hypothetical protein
MFLNFPSWSISAEFWTYALFAVICLAPPRWVPWLAGTTGLAALAVLMGAIDPGFGQSFGQGLFRAICFFMLGYLCSVVWRRIRHLPLPAASAVELAIVAIVVLLTSQADSATVRLLMPLAFGMAVLVFAFEGGMVSRLLSCAPMRILGQRSYSVYMIHILVFSVMGLFIRLAERGLDVTLHSASHLDTGLQFLLDFGSPWIMDALTIVQVLVVVWLAGFSYRHIEQAGQDWTQSRIAAWKRRRTVPRFGQGSFSQPQIEE